jgi:GNAT superfamily N-acetyltransferase
MELVIRSLQSTDSQRLVAMDEQITERRRQAWYEGKLERALSQSDVQISLGAEKDGLLVGAVLGSVHYGEFGLPEPVAVLDTILVDREFSRQGIGRAMFEQFIKNLQGLRIEKVRTEVSWMERDLVAFFSKHGFEPLPRLVLEKNISEL